MKKSVNLYFTNKVPAKEKLIQIKNIGFEEFFTGVSENNEGLSLSEQVEFARNLGLKCTMIHCSYIEPNLHYFWEEGKKGEEICDEYCRQIKLSSGLTDNFVVHLNGSKNQSQSRIGLLRLQKMLEVCDTCNMNFCIENLYSETEIPFIFENINHPRLKICFDTGHRNFLTPDFNPLQKYGKHVAVLHMHDNYGFKDDHLCCGEGSIDWKKFAQEIKLFPDLVLSAEVKDNDTDCETVLQNIYDSLCSVEKLISD